MDLMWMVFTWFIVCSHGFINVESLRQNAKEGPWGSLKMGFSGRHGNVDKVSGDMNTLNGYRSHDDEFLLLGGYKYGKNNKMKNTDEGHFHFRFTRYFPPLAGLESYVQVQFDRFKLLALRRIVGSGLRWRLKNSLFFGSGILYEHEVIDNRSEKGDGRGNFYIAWPWDLGETKQFSLVLYYQPLLRFWNDYRLSVDSVFSVSLSESFSVFVKWYFRRDSHPPSGVVSDDLSYLSGLSFEY